MAEPGASERAGEPTGSYTPTDFEGYLLEIERCLAEAQLAYLQKNYKRTQILVEEGLLGIRAAQRLPGHGELAGYDVLFSAFLYQCERHSVGLALFEKNIEPVPPTTSAPVRQRELETRAHFAQALASRFPIALWALNNAIGPK